ncbi:MAG: B12-binding domain-containing radical SAM protein, partial [Planctomycetota bacterium]
MVKGKVVFVRPPNLQKSGQWKKQGVIRCPLNLCMLAGYLRERGSYECGLVDFEVEPGNTPEQIAESILRHDPKYVCFTTLSPRFPVVVRTSQALKKVAPDTVVIIGGPHVSGSPDNSIFEGIDFGVMGEGEEALLELLDTLEAGGDPGAVANLIYQEGDKVRVNPPRPFILDLDTLPPPAWELMDIEAYTDPTYFDGPHLAVFSSRGCAHDCSFCASGVTWKRRLRVHSAGNVIETLRFIRHDLGVRNFMFWDDSFNTNRKRAIEICNGMIREDLRMKYTVQARADQMTEELAVALKQSGCVFAAIGVESGNDEILRAIDKKETKEHFKNAASVM